MSKLFDVLSKFYRARTICKPTSACFQVRFTSFAPPKKLAKPDLRTKNKNEIGLGGYLLLLVPMGTFALGTWQIKRKAWKEKLIEGLTVKTQQPPIPLPENDEELQSLEYRKIRVTGRFDHSKEMYLGPRSRLENGESTYDGKLMSNTQNESSGYLVVTPFILSESGESILVSRGWIPFPKKDPAKRPEGQILDEVTLTGVVRLSEARPKFTVPRMEKVRVWFHRDVEGMAADVGARPVYLEATADSTVPGGPVGGQTLATLRNEHLSYILTWYALSGATAYMWYSKYFKRL